MNKFAEKLKKLRQQQGLQPEQVADAVGLYKRTYLSYENGERTPRIDVACIIADYYGVKLDWLCNDKAMSKDEFTRKVIGEQQHKKNEWLKKQMKHDDAECFEIGVALKIRKKNYGY